MAVECHGWPHKKSNNKRYHAQRVLYRERRGTVHVASEVQAQVCYDLFDLGVKPDDIIGIMSHGSL
jgi:hypothetical protein